jgi:hypothetical protein
MAEIMDYSSFKLQSEMIQTNEFYSCRTPYSEGLLRHRRTVATHADIDFKADIHRYGRSQMYWHLIRRGAAGRLAILCSLTLLGSLSADSAWTCAPLTARGSCRWRSGREPWRHSTHPLRILTRNRVTRFCAAEKHDQLSSNFVISWRGADDFGITSTSFGCSPPSSSSGHP